MNLQSVPTDNLYKFMAVSGLVLLIFSSYFPITQIRQLEGRSDELELELTALEVEMKQLQVAASRAETMKRPSREEVRLLRQTANELERRLALFKVKKAILDRLVRQSKQLLAWMLIGTVGGAMLSTVGFTLWYLRLQRFQDDAIRAK